MKLDLYKRPFVYFYLTYRNLLRNNNPLIRLCKCVYFKEKKNPTTSLYNKNVRNSHSFPSPIATGVSLTKNGQTVSRQIKIEYVCYENCLQLCRKICKERVVSLPLKDVSKKLCFRKFTLLCFDYSKKLF